MSESQLFDRQPLFDILEQAGQSAWVADLRKRLTKNLAIDQHGTLPQWIAAWEKLPRAENTTFDASGKSVSVHGPLEPEVRTELQKTLMQFHPWRKGPFEIFGIEIDTEWRSNMKWQRVASAIDFRGRRVLDVGCGNGYYGWKMLDAGADLVVGCDPLLQYVMQFEILRRYAPRPERHFLVPLADNELPSGLQFFDVTLSMGVLYHRSSPIDHLQTLWHTLKPGGQLLLETLILDGEGMELLVPPGRYAKMRNVWFIPTADLMQRWLQRTGFEAIEIVDVTATTVAEQRSTAWMTYESLADFLDADDPRLTLEGHPAPVRGLFVARRR